MERALCREFVLWSLVLLWLWHLHVHHLEAVLVQLPDGGESQPVNVRSERAEVAGQQRPEERRKAKALS